MKSCSQCFKELVTCRDEFKTWRELGFTLGYCTNPACPNYGIVQVPAEDMPKEEKEIFIDSDDNLSMLAMHRNVTKVLNKMWKEKPKATD